jgi:GT2 family glycosyltransferase
MRATVVVTQRERFALSERSLDSLYATAAAQFELIYVDGRSPAPISAMLQRQAKRRGFELIRREEYLPPNVARNLALARVRTEYVVFVDNDVVFEHGWLAALIECADETGADLVTPLVCIGDPQRRERLRVHFAGGTMSVGERDGRRWFADEHTLSNARYADVAGRLARGRSDCVEFHAALARTSVLEAIGPFDEDLRATSEHLDLSLLVARNGGEVWVEPRSVVTYVVGKPLERNELPFFCLRWSDHWAVHSERSFLRKWGFAWDPRVLETFVQEHRTHAFAPLLRTLVPRIGWRLSQAIYRALYGYYARRGLAHAPADCRRYVAPGPCAATSGGSP